MSTDPIRAREARPFHFVPIDADSFIFQKILLTTDVIVYRSRFKAVLDQHMNQELRANNHAEGEPRIWSDDDYIVRMYLNRSGLKYALEKHRSNFTRSDLEKAMVSFASRGLNWDIIDCGPGDDKADDLIQRDWELFANDQNCIKMIEGVCHDHGYMDRLRLRQYGLKSSMSRKITLLTCHSTNSTYKDLPFEITSFPGVFQVKPLKPSDDHHTAYTKVYTDSFPGTESALVRALQAENAVEGLSKAQRTEVDCLKASLVEAEATIVDLFAVIGANVEHQGERSTRTDTNLDENQDNMSSTRVRTSLCSIPEKMLCKYRQLMGSRRMAPAKDRVYVDYASCAQTEHLVAPEDTTQVLQNCKAEEAGMPVFYQHLEVDGDKLNPESTFRSLTTGPEIRLRMLPCSFLEPLDLLRKPQRNEWVTVLNGGWGKARVGHMGERTGPRLPKLEECRTNLLANAFQARASTKYHDSNEMVGMGGMTALPIITADETGAEIFTA